MKVKFLLLILLITLFYTNYTDAQIIERFHPCTAVTGDSDHALDYIDGDNIDDNHVAVVGFQDATYGFNSCIYVVDADASCGGTSTDNPICPQWVQPQNNAGNKCWRRTTPQGDQPKEQIQFTNGSWNCDLDNDGSCTDTNEANWDMGMNYLQFPTTADSGAESLITKLPSYFDSKEDEVTIKIYWIADNGYDEDTENVMWCPSYRHCSPSSNECTWSSYTEDCLTADNTSDTANNINESTETVTNAEVDAWAAGDLIQIKLIRDTDNDNMAEDALLVGVTLEYDRNW